MAILEDALKRVPPQSLDAEESVLGGILLDSHALDRVVELMSAGDFYRESHKKIFRAMLALSERGEPIDLITLTDSLRSKGELQDVGGATYLAELQEKIPSAANIAHYAKIVREKAILRGLINVCNEIAGRCYGSGQDDIDHFLDDAERLIYNVSEQRTRPAFIKLGDMIMDTIKMVEQLYERKELVTGVPTGFLDLDSKTAGLQPSDLIIVAARPSMGKCLKYDAEVIDAATGQIQTIEEICRAQQSTLFTLDSRWKLQTTRPSHYVYDGVKPVYRVRTALGREVETTLSHPFLTFSGWRPLADLKVGERIAVPRVLPVFGQGEISEDRVKLLGYLLGDGDLTQACPRFTNSNPRVMDDFLDCIARFGQLRGTINTSQGMRTPTCRVAAIKEDRSVLAKTVGEKIYRAREESGLSQRQLAFALGVSPALWCCIEKGTQLPSALCLEKLASILDKPLQHFINAGEMHERRNPLSRWLSDLGLTGKGAAEKFIPSLIFTLKKNLVALFLNRLFSCDGSASVYSSAGQASVSYSSVSPKLVRQIQHLLLRFGILSKLRTKQVRYKNARRTAYEVEILGAQDILTFAREIGMWGKEEQLQRVVATVQTRGRGWTKDTLVGVWTFINAARAGQSWRMIYQMLGYPVSHNIHSDQRQPRRDTVHLLGQALGSQLLLALANSDVYWDTVTAIEYVGDHPVYDLTVPGAHNFIANDILVHNTAFVLNVAQYAALHSNIPVAIFSLEMSKEQLVMRLLCSEARVDNAKVRTGYLSERDFPRLAMAAGRLSDAPIYVDDTPGQNILEMRAKARRLKREANIGLLIIDYLQLMRGFSQENRTQELSEISRGLKSLAKELNIPVVALSQLNRQVELRADKRPIMSDIRESGSIEQDADVIMFIYRDEVYKPDSQDEGIAEIIIGKQRNGPTGTVRLTFRREYTRFENFIENMGAPGEMGEEG